MPGILPVPAFGSPLKIKPCNPGSHQSASSPRSAAYHGHDNRFIQNPLPPLPFNLTSLWNQQSSLVARPVQSAAAVNATMMSLVCPVCGAEMKRIKTEHGTFVRWHRFKCTCGHCEDRKEDGSVSANPHSLLAVDGFQEFPSGGT